MRPVVFIHTNAKQLLGAMVSKYSIETMSQHRDRFDARFIHLEEQDALYRRNGQTYLRKGMERVWNNADLQSFTPTRFLAPQLMDFQGRALVVDPDVFSVRGDVIDLLERDMAGKAIVSRKVSPGDGRPRYFATSVMLLDCAKLRHWQWERDIERMFNKNLDYHDWMSLYTESPDTIGELEEEWNHFDTLDERTKLLHNTGRVTQPWKTGLPIDFVKHEAAGVLTPIRKRWLSIFSRYRPSQGLTRYQPHPDKTQERFFFSLAKACLDDGILTQDFVRRQIEQGHVRTDFFDMLAAVSGGPRNW